MSWEYLPLLKSSFFTNLEVSTISHLLKTGDFWSKSLMPVGLWENSAIIATTDPNYVAPDMGVPCIMVRAEKKDLEALYNTAFIQRPEPVAIITTTPVVPEANNIAIPEVPSLPDFQIPAMPTEDAAPISVSEEPVPEINLTIPDVPDVNIDFSGLNIQENSSTPPPIPTEPEEVTKRFVTPEASVPTSNNVVTMPNSTSTPPAIGADWNIQPFLKDFDKVMFLKWMGTHLEVTTWLGPWEINPHASKKIDVSGNSIFKIPLKSTYPYHGHVIGNSVNDSFFQNFNAGRTPEHVTIFPVYSNDSFYGEVVCFTTKAKGEKINLDSYDQFLHKAKIAS